MYKQLMIKMHPQLKLRGKILKEETGKKYLLLEQKNRKSSVSPKHMFLHLYMQSYNLS
jgi:hypothetical protein